MYRVLGVLSMCIGVVLLFSAIPAWEFVFAPAVQREGGSLAALSLLGLLVVGAVVFIVLGFGFLRKGRRAISS